MSRYEKTRSTLNDHSLAPKKRFGQNFLVNSNTAQRIVRASGVCGDDTILEVGVGLGALTVPLAETAGHVIGLEIDNGIIRFHKEENDLPDNVTLIHQDVLKADFNQLSAECGGKLKIVANLPYSISNPFIFKLIDNRELVDSATIMLQKEVAERLCAPPSTKEYGVPSVLLQSCANITRLLTLKPAEFHPRPKIDSVVIKIQFMGKSPGPADAPYDFELFRKIVRVTFNQRRKTISNTLSNAGFFIVRDNPDKQRNKEMTLRAIEHANIPPSARPEILDIQQFIELARSFEAALQGARIST